MLKYFIYDQGWRIKSIVGIDEQTELSHGGIETRRYESILNPLALESNEVLTRWKELKSIHRVVRKRLDKRSGKTSEEMVYYISSST